MENTFWNHRYAENKGVYGLEPNPFFKQFIDSHKPGSILLPAEGEGRNAVYAATKGWLVDAFDFSEVAKEKALQFAKEKGVAINYNIMRIEDFKAEKEYDAVGLVYVHLPTAIRKNFHRQVYQSLKQEGHIVLEAFSKDQLHFTSGGPKDADMLYDTSTLVEDFDSLKMLICQQKELELNEGLFHQGTGSVVQMLGQNL